MSTLLYKAASTAIDAERDRLYALSTDIWEHPEEGFEEKHAHDALVQFLQDQGFKVEPHFLLPTAFKAEFTPPRGDGGVTVAILCEYDALPVIGHACGHNLIAEAGVAAALGVKAALESDSGRSIRGRVVVLGTPAEEGGGGKVKLLSRGAFENVDFCMMSHPGKNDHYRPLVTARSHVTATYEGLEAHAGLAPWEGVNALDAAVAAYDNVSRLRQQMKPDWRVHGIISDGGTKPNIIPARASLQYNVRTPSNRDLGTLRDAVTRCLESAALGANCRITYQWDKDGNYDDVKHNAPMAEAYRRHAESMGVDYEGIDLSLRYGGSTDAGNVSYVLPTIHPFFGIPTDANNHTREFAVDAGKPEAQEATLVSAKAMANTALDLMGDEQLRLRVEEDFAAVRE